MKKIFLVALVISMFSPFGVVTAQPGDPGTDPDVPITGIEVLIGAGGAFGIKKLMEKRNKKNK
jgi:hypothetical protein